MLPGLLIPSGPGVPCAVCRFCLSLVVCAAVWHSIRPSKIKSRARYRRQSFCHFQSPALKLCARPTKKAPSTALCRISALWSHKYLYLCPVRQPWRNCSKIWICRFDGSTAALYHSGCCHGNCPGEQRRKADCNMRKGITP